MEVIGVDRLNPFYDPFLETHIDACEPYMWSIFFFFWRNGLSCCSASRYM